MLYNDMQTKNNMHFEFYSDTVQLVAHVSPGSRYERQFSSGSNVARLQGSLIVLENAGSSSCSHGNTSMSGALSSFRDVRCGAACELRDAGCICEYAFTV